MLNLTKLGRLFHESRGDDLEKREIITYSLPVGLG
jgi:hypothetical protein